MQPQNSSEIEMQCRLSMADLFPYFLLPNPPTSHPLSMHPQHGALFFCVFVHEFVCPSVCKSIRLSQKSNGKSACELFGENNW